MAYTCIKQENASNEFLLEVESTEDQENAINDQAAAKARAFIDELMDPFRVETEAVAESHKNIMEVLKQRQEDEMKMINSDRASVIDIAEKMAEQLNFVLENKHTIQEILEKPIEKNSLHIRRELQQETVSAFKKIVDFINNTPEIIETYSDLADINWEDTLAKLEADVHQVGTTAAEQNVLFNDIVSLRAKVSHLREHTQAYEDEQ